MRNVIVAAGIFLAGIAGMLGLQNGSKSITLAWDPMPVTESWQAVHLYDISVTPEVLLAAPACSVGPPIVCPTQVAITITKKPYSFVVRSWDGVWESDNSNVVPLAGGPKAPTNLVKK
jgi:hypothetical protein